MVIGADQLVEIDRRILTKPQNRTAAREQIQLLSGRTHEIITGIFLISPAGHRSAVDVSRVSFFDLTSQEVEAYLDSNEWEGCAGGYRVEGRGQWLIKNIEGDRSNIQGLPMLQLVRLLRELNDSI